MESKRNNQFLIDIPNYNGSLEILLDLAKTQKVDLADISITKLADNFLDYVKKSENLNLETASEYLLMATWLAYLKSKLLLPEDDNEDFKALEVAERLKLQLKRLELIRLLSDQLLKKKRIGKDIFYRGMKGGIKSIYTPIYDVSLYELLKTYANINMQKSFQRVNIPKLPVLTTEQGINNIKNQINELNDWKDIVELIPDAYKQNLQKKKTGLSGILAASLELTKEGLINIMQKKTYDKILIKKK
jgi:segregation and condensation protein A